MRFQYSTTSPAHNEFDSLPRIPLLLRREEQRVEVVGLVDSGATVNVLPYELGLELGGFWDDRKAIIQLAGNLSNQPAMPLRLHYACRRGVGIPVGFSTLALMRVFAQKELQFRTLRATLP